MSMNYNLLKKLIVRYAERTGKRNVNFKIDIDGLNTAVEELELLCLPYGSEAHRVELTDIPLVNEYFREDKMKWMSDEKYLTTLIFVDSNKVDDYLEKMIADLKVSYEDDPDIDHVAIISEILGTYPCYLMLVVSYQNNSPNSIGKNSYYLGCRSNKVIIKDPAYVYTPAHPIPDPVHPDSSNTTPSTNTEDEDDVIEDAEVEEDDIEG